MTNFKYVELFAGIGGFRAALDKLGGECVLAAEWDKFARQSYTALYGGDHLHGDVTKIDENEVPDHDVMAFGMPCQAFSVAGKRLGFDDMRGTLYFEAMRIAKAKKPKVLWMENVKGLVGHDKGRTLEVMAQAMCDLGYTIDFDVLNSKYFGVPQNRERIFLIGIRDDLIEEKPWVTGGRTDVVAKGKKRISALAGVKTFNFDWPSQDAVTARLRDILEPEVDEKYYLSGEKTAKLVAQLEDKHREKLDDINSVITDDGPSHKYNVKDKITPPVRAQGGGRQPGMWIIQEAQSGTRLREESGTLRTGGTDHQHVVEEVRATLTSDREEKRQQGRRFKENDEPAFTLNTQDKHGVAISGVVEQYSKGDGVSCCLDANYTKGTAPGDVGKGRRTHIVEETPKYRIRKLTPLECWRLQGFSDEAHKTVKAAGISDSQRYKQAGNAVTVNVIEAIGRKLLRLCFD